MRLKDKIAIITGAGSGSGRAGSQIFAREGAKVVVGDISRKAGEETVKMVKDKGGEATFVEIDAGKVDDMKRLIDTTVNVYGKINILWNHAGIPGPSIIEDTDEAGFDKLMDVNIKGGFFATKFAIPHLKKAGGGSIIFTASIAALKAAPYSPAYGMTKTGLVGLTMALAVYLGPHNIRVNCICPTLIDSPMGRVFVDRAGKLTADEREKVVQSYAKAAPLGRIASPYDIGNAALLLASDEANYWNGVVLPVDAGLSVKLI